MELQGSLDKNEQNILAMQIDFANTILAVGEGRQEHNAIILNENSDLHAQQIGKSIIFCKNYYVFRIHFTFFKKLRTFTKNFFVSSLIYLSCTN